MRINKEGYKIIGISGAVCVFLWWLIYHLLVSDANISLLWVSAVLLLLYWFFIVAFFREPRRVRIHDADLAFSPCDGRVVVTEVVKENEYLNEEMLQISIFMSVTNVHMNWVPVAVPSNISNTIRAVFWWRGIPSPRPKTNAPRPW